LNATRTIAKKLYEFSSVLYKHIIITGVFEEFKKLTFENTMKK